MTNQDSWKTEEDTGGQLSNDLTISELSAIDKFRKEHPETPATEAIKEKEPVAKTWLALVGSNDEDFGIVEDTMADIMWVSGKGELVGTWTRARFDNMIHISLMTSIQALQDRSVITWKKYYDERKAMRAGGKKPRKVKAAHEKEEAVEQPAELSVEVQLGFNNLRAKLMKMRRK